MQLNCGFCWGLLSKNYNYTLFVICRVKWRSLIASNRRLIDFFTWNTG